MYYSSASFAICLLFQLFSAAAVTVTLPNKPTPPENNTPSNRSAWGVYDISTDYAYVVPETNVVREYNLTVTNAMIAPDGYMRPGMVINGAYPGPTIEANWGDTLRINLHNNLTNLNGTTLHFHGVRMLNQNFEDGTPGITECPVPPNSSKTYEFRVTQYGTTWYHSHFGLQYPDGLSGAMKFHGPSSANYDEDLGPIMLSDWLHAPASSLYYLEMEGVPPKAPSYVMQGKGVYQCQPGEPCIQQDKYHTVHFESTKTYKMSLINSGTDTQFTFWIQNHNFTVIATDFVAIDPYVTDTINIAVGQRYEIIVTANATTAFPDAGTDFWIFARDCSQTAQVSTMGIIRYNSSSNANPGSSGGNREAFGCADPPVDHIVPVVARNVGKPVNNMTANDYLNIALEGYPNPSELSGPLHKWLLGGTSMYLNWSMPTLKHIKDTNDTDGSLMLANTTPIFLDYESESWVYFLIQNNSTEVIANHLFYRAAHPIHLHGHDFVILAQGSTNFNASQVTLNLSNPPRRDTATLEINGYLIIGFQVDNPGAWLMHCHIPWHASSGMALQFVSQPDKINPLLQLNGVDKKIDQECAAWTTHYNKFNIPADVVQDESGI